MHEPNCNESLAKVEKAGSEGRQLERWPTNSAVFSLAFVRGRVGHTNVPEHLARNEHEGAWVQLSYMFCTPIFSPMHGKSDDN